VTRIGAQSSQPRADFPGSVDRGWRVEPLPSRVGLCARMPERSRADLLERGIAIQRAADTCTGADAKGRGRR
jgi:hypothetical protein